MVHFIVKNMVNAMVKLWFNKTLKNTNCLRQPVSEICPKRKLCKTVQVIYFFHRQFLNNNDITSLFHLSQLKIKFTTK